MMSNVIQFSELKLVIIFIGLPDRDYRHHLSSESLSSRHSYFPISTLFFCPFPRERPSCKDANKFKTVYSGHDMHSSLAVGLIVKLPLDEWLTPIRRFHPCFHRMLRKFYFQLANGVTGTGIPTSRVVLLITG